MSDSENELDTMAKKVNEIVDEKKPKSIEKKEKKQTGERRSERPHKSPRHNGL